MKRILCVVAWLGCFSMLQAHVHTRLSLFTCTNNKASADHCNLGHYIMGGFTTVVKDGLELNCNLLSVDTAKILAAFTPVYVGTRFVDEPLQERFYDCKEHKNINQMPSTFCRVVEEGAFGIMIGLSSLAFFGQSTKSRLVGRIFGIGAVSALLGKRIVKKLEFKGGKRPWHQSFSKKQRSYGGFPSGHMVEAAYTATVFGWQYGFKAAFPLSLYAGLMFGVSVNRNRHYVSQVVAGTAVGVLYGVAANRLIDKRLDERLSLQITTNAHGAPTLGLSYQF